MIKFFRNIRYNLMEKNEILKYLKYAIGEIVLVVIGIMIAISINSWLDQRRLVAEEIDILRELHESLVIDLANLNENVKINQRIKKSIPILLSHMDQDLAYHDSLKYHFGNTGNVWPFDLNVSVFENLKSKDFNLISNEDLRQNIIGLYGRQNTNLKNSYERYYNVLEDGSINILNTRFEEFWDGNYKSWKNDTNPDNLKSIMIPLDYEKLKVDQEYLYFLRSLRNRYDWLMESYSGKMIASIKSLIKKIEDEIKILEN